MSVWRISESSPFFWAASISASRPSEKALARNLGSLLRSARSTTLDRVSSSAYSCALSKSNARSRSLAFEYIVSNVAPASASPLASNARTAATRTIGAPSPTADFAYPTIFGSARISSTRSVSART